MRKISNSHSCSKELQMRHLLTQSRKLIVIESHHQTNNQCIPMKAVSLMIVKMVSIITPSQVHCSKNSNLSHTGIRYSLKRHSNRFKATRVPKIRPRKRSQPRHTCRVLSNHHREGLHLAILFYSLLTHRQDALQCLATTFIDSQVNLHKKSRQSMIPRTT